MFKKLIFGGLFLALSFITVMPANSANTPMPSNSPPAATQGSDTDTKVDPECNNFCCMCGCC